jgi:hypothetical protein
MNKEEQLMAYLYGEMSPEERRDFEEVLKEDAELRNELEEVQGTRFQLAELTDIEPQATVFNLGSLAKPNWRTWGIRVGIAASFLLLLGLTNARLEFTDSSFTIAFGENKAETEAVPSAVASAQQEDYFKNVLFRQEMEFNQKLMALDSVWQVQLTASNHTQQAQLAQQWQGFQKKRQADFVALKTQFKEEQLPQFAALLQEMQVEQKQEMQFLLTELYDNWEQARVYDLKAIETEFVNLYKNVERNQTETAAVLDDIVNGNFLN